MKTLRLLLWVGLIGALGVGCATGPRQFDVALQVDYGPAGIDPIDQVVTVERGATAEDALKEACSVERGAACCDPREVSGISGVTVNPATNRWWTVAINGSKKVSPYETKLNPGDTVRWEYREYDQ